MPPYLKAKTNGPYLIGPDGTYVRDPATGEPLVWDEAAGTARPIMSFKSENMALEASFKVDGVTCRPAFELLREHLKKFTPEWGEDHRPSRPPTSVASPASSPPRRGSAALS